MLLLWPTELFSMRFIKVFYSFSSPRTEVKSSGASIEGLGILFFGDSKFENILLFDADL